jgi:hypothetical protein
MHSRLDYCKGILANAPLDLVNSQQSMLQSAARLVLRLTSALGQRHSEDACPAPLVASAAAHHFHSNACTVLLQPTRLGFQCCDGSSTCGTPICSSWTSTPTWHSNVCCGPAWFLVLLRQSCCLEHSSLLTFSAQSTFLAKK